MSDTSWLHSSPTYTPVPGGAEDGLLGSLTPLLREWLPRQRWFAGKGRPITGFGLVSATELLPGDGRIGTPGMLHLLLDVHQSDRRPECYQLLLGTRPLLPPALAPALIGHAVGGPLDGLTVHEALYDPGWPGCCWNGCGHPDGSGNCASAANPRSGSPAGWPPAVHRRAVQHLRHLRRYVHPEALPAGGPRPQPRPGTVAGAGPGRLTAGGGPGGMVRGRGDVRGTRHAGGTATVPARRHGRLGPGPAGGRHRDRLHRRGARPGPGHRRGAPGAGPRPAHRRTAPPPDLRTDGGHGRAAGRGRARGPGPAALPYRAAHRLPRPGRTG